MFSKLTSAATVALFFISRMYSRKLSIPRAVLTKHAPPLSLMETGINLNSGARGER
jgi:hypothetical protein